MHPRWLLLLVLLSACAAPTGPAPAPDELAVVAATIRYWRTRISGTAIVPFPTQKDTLVPMGLTSFEPSGDILADSIIARGVRPVMLWATLEGDPRQPEAWTGVSSTLRAAYRKANARPARLDRPPVVPGIEVSLQSDGWSTLRFPVLYLSRPGFSPTRDSALVHVTEVCGGLCGEGTTVLLIRTTRGWRAVTTYGAEFS
jgi:hypothetical protein